jgi:hypothetical protein
VLCILFIFCLQQLLVIETGRSLVLQGLRSFFHASVYLQLDKLIRITILRYLSLNSSHVNYTRGSGQKN